MINRWNLVALILVVIAGWGAVTVGSRAQEIEDDYSIHTVKGVLEYPAGFSPSFLEKQTNRLGDRASIAVLKIFDAEELTKPENVRKILPLIHDAFVAPEIISRREDRNPRITLFLLAYLGREVNAPDIRREVSETEQFVRDKTTAKR